MEVHHHAHTARKKWTHYFWEFLMLFLAVFCGFLAENQREHMIEHQREKQYMHSLVQDISTDTTNLTAWVSLYKHLEGQCDSVLINFAEFSKAGSKQSAENFSTLIFGFPDFIYTDQTIQQLKGSGNLRLIREREVTDSIISYDAAAQDIYKEETEIERLYSELSDLSNRIFSYRKMNETAAYVNKPFLPGAPVGNILKSTINYWIVTDAVTMESLYNLVYKYREAIVGFRKYLFALKQKAVGMIGFLQKEYHLK